MANTFYKCPDCPAQVRNVSIASHRATCPGLRKDVVDEEKVVEQIVVEETPIKQNNAGRFERRSAAKAKDRFKEINNIDDEDPDQVSSIVSNENSNYSHALFILQFVVERVSIVHGRTLHAWKQALQRFNIIHCRNCTFKASTVKEMSVHFIECDRVQPFECKVCKMRATTREKIIEHVRRRHFKNDEADPFEDSNSEAEIDAASSSESDEQSMDEEDDSDENADDDDDDEMNEDYDDNGGTKSKKKTKKSKKSINLPRTRDGIELQTLPDRRCT